MPAGDQQVAEKQTQSNTPFADASKIEWCDASWEVTAGCSKVSSGCAHCYAETLVGTRLAGVARKRKADGTANGSAVDVSLDVIKHVNHDGRWSAAQWNGNIELLEMNLEQPLKRKTPTVYFVNSRSDLFHERVPFEYIDRVFAVMALCPQHRFLVLTKRPERMREYLSDKKWHPDDSYTYTRDHLVEGQAQRLYEERMGECAREWLAVHWPLPNVWLGTSAEDQATADARVPELLACPAAGRFISAEPLLGEIDLGAYVISSSRYHMCMDVRGAIRNKSFDGLQHPDGTAMTRRQAEDALWKIHATGAKVIPAGSCDDFDDQVGCRGHKNPGIDWVIVGGESGVVARPCEIGWVRRVVEQCKRAGVPVFVKQLGKRAVIKRESATRWLELSAGRKGERFECFPDDLRVREVPDDLLIGVRS